MAPPDSSPPPSYSEVIINPAYSGCVEFLNPPAYHWAADEFSTPGSTSSPVVDGSTQTGNTGTTNATTNTTNASSGDENELSDCQCRSLCVRMRDECRRCSSCNVSLLLQTRFYFILSAVYFYLTAVIAVIVHALRIHFGEILLGYSVALIMTGMISWVGLNVTRQRFKKHRIRFLIALYGATSICVGAAMCYPEPETYLIPAAVAVTSLIFAITNLYERCHDAGIKKHLILIMFINGILCGILYGLLKATLDPLFNNAIETIQSINETYNNQTGFADFYNITAGTIVLPKTVEEVKAEIVNKYLVLFLTGGIFLNSVIYVIFMRISGFTNEIPILITESFIYLCIFPVCGPPPTY